MWQAFRDQLRVMTIGEVVRNRVFQPIGRFFAKAPYLGLLTCIATAASAISGWYSYKSSINATEVAERAQAFTEKVYQDQVALGRPSIEAMSGNLYVSGYTANSFSNEKPNSIYSLRVVLRNSGQRSTERVWVSASSDTGSDRSDWLPVQVVELPKGVDVPVIFTYKSQPFFDAYRTDWYVAFVYEDRVPSPVGAPSVVCSDVSVMKMASTPTDPSKSLDQDAGRALSVGSPVAVGLIKLNEYRQITASNTQEAVRNDVVGEIWNEKACPDKKFVQGT